MFFKSDNIFFMTRMLENGYFLLTYNRDKIKTGKEEFFESE